VSSAESPQLVYDFTDGSRDMRDLLGGKGANVAEMTRILGAERVPAGFTITTEACVAYMEAARSEPEGLEAQVSEALAALEQRAGKRLDDRGPAAGLGALGCARVDAGITVAGRSSTRRSSRAGSRAPATRRGFRSRSGRPTRCASASSSSSIRVSRAR
jgi:hypothetical protein